MMLAQENTRRPRLSLCRSSKRAGMGMGMVMVIGGSKGEDRGEGGTQWRTI